MYLGYASYGNLIGCVIKNVPPLAAILSPPAATVSIPTQSSVSEGTGSVSVCATLSNTVFEDVDILLLTSDVTGNHFSVLLTCSSAPLQLALLPSWLAPLPPWPPFLWPPDLLPCPPCDTTPLYSFQVPFVRIKCDLVNHWYCSKWRYRLHWCQRNTDISSWFWSWFYSMFKYFYHWWSVTWGNWDIDIATSSR